MQKQSRRFELLLPTKFNSGEQVPGEIFADTLLELEEQFGVFFVRNSKNRWTMATSGTNLPRSFNSCLCRCGRHAWKSAILRGIQRAVEKAFPTTRHLDDDVFGGSDLKKRRSSIQLTSFVVKNICNLLRN